MISNVFIVFLIINQDARIWIQWEILYFETQTGGSFLLRSHSLLSTGSQQVLKVLKRMETRFTIYISVPDMYLGNSAH